MRLMQWRAAMCTALCVIAGCGGGSGSESGRAQYGGESSYATSGGMSVASVDSADADESYYAAEEAPSPMPAMPRAPAAAMPASGPATNIYAQAGGGTAAQGAVDGGADRASQNSPTATDASPGGGPLLIYEASLFLGVFKVEDNIKAVAAAAREVGGFLARQTDNAIVVRVPAAKFEQVITSVEALGDVLHREVQATDVSEEFRDVEIRIRNALQVRDRLAELLSRAQNVEESLQIEQQLERVTAEIERLKGRMRFLQDRIAYSTITVTFQPKAAEQLNQSTFRLPFDWLDSLSLQWLLSL